MDPRHERRIELLQNLFAWTFTPQTLERALESQTGDSLTLLQSLDEIDAKIKAAAPERPLSEVNKVDLAVLRLILFEASHTKTPKKVLIDEAIELAKEFGSDSSSKFVNGVLAKLLLETAE